MAAQRPWFTLAAEKYFFTGGAGEKMHWNYFSRLQTGKLCEAFAAAAAGDSRCFDRKELCQYAHIDL